MRNNKAKDEIIVSTPLWNNMAGNKKINEVFRRHFCKYQGNCLMFDPARISPMRPVRCPRHRSPELPRFPGSYQPMARQPPLQ
ncbi:hypothetical protein LJR034_003788 [Caballeronia sp. LjRoot34]|uniref:hypothetical protein n=1 Tax=Caballeronia sp. LjRoot34 TaxID=3342325 RepID=UPI003ED0AF8C